MFKQTALYSALLIVMIVTMASLTVASVHIMSALRAYVSGESLWSKAQKDAIQSLSIYAQSGQLEDYRQFSEQLRVPEGDRRARLEMDRDNPNPAIIKAGFIAGGINPLDIDGMSWLYRHLSWLPDVKRAVAFWQAGDNYIYQLRLAGERLHDDIKVGRQAGASVVALTEIKRINSALMPIEAGFSDALGDVSRLTYRILVNGIGTIAILLIALGFAVIRILQTRSHLLLKRLQISEERLTLGFQGSNAGMWDWDIRNQKVYYSAWIERTLGFAPTDLTSTTADFIALIHPDDRDATQATTDAHFLRGTPYKTEFRLRKTDGTYLWCRSRGQAVRDADGTPLRMVGSLIDITDLKAAEALAFNEKELAQVTLAAIADAVIATDTEGRITYCNKVAETLLGQTSENIYRWPLTVACRIFNENDGEEVDDLVGSALRGSSPLAADSMLVLHRMDGGIVPIDHSVAPIHDLAGAVVGAVIVLHDVSEVRQHAAQLSHQANHDALTGIPNRREFERQLTTLLADDETHRSHAVMYLDLDQLKVINDTCGHAAGDDLICQVSAILQQRLRDGDVLARLGGDEFGVVLRNCVPDNANRVAEQLRQGIADIRFVWAKNSFAIGVSIGLVTFKPGSTTLKEIMKGADAACYLAKEKGRNRVHLYRADDAELSQRKSEMNWVSRIKHALDHDRFCLYSQVIVPLKKTVELQSTGHVEILLRMVDQDGSLILPMAFIPAAERYDLMRQIDRWVINQTFRMLAGQSAQTPPPISTCAINLSGGSLGDDFFLDYVLEQQAQYQIPWDVLCFEITETAAIANLSKAAMLITRLRQLGCRFSLDDFGAGMSSFGYLKHLPVDYLKIDGSFVKDMLHDEIDCAMVAAIHQIGHVMGKQTIAEFVENESIRDKLCDIGVDFAQGYGIGKPEPLIFLYSSAQPDLEKTG